MDLTWAIPSVIGSIDGWMVREDLETLSDHVYISFSVGVRSLRPFRNNRDVGRRWNLSKMDKEAFDLSLEWACSSETLEDDDLSARDFSIWMDEAMEEACDASTPRVGRRHPKRAAYWWSDSIADLKSSCIRARRLWQRGRRRGPGSSSDNLEDLQNSYRLRKRELRRAISKAKSVAWEDFIRTIDSDPWGLPYRVVLKKLGGSSPSLSETLDPHVLNRLLDSLFPRSSARDAPADWRNFAWNDEWAVLYGEVFRLVKGRMHNAASCPDGFKATLWKSIPNCMLGYGRVSTRA